MSIILGRPLLIFIISLLAQWLAAYIGDFLRKRRRAQARPSGTSFGPCGGRTSSASEPDLWVHARNRPAQIRQLGQLAGQEGEIARNRWRVMAIGKGEVESSILSGSTILSL